MGAAYGLGRIPVDKGGEGRWRRRACVFHQVPSHTVMKPLLQNSGARFHLVAAVLASCLGFVSTGCSGDVPDLGGGDVADPADIAQLRMILGGQGVVALTAPPARSAALIELGRALFFDKELSGNRDVSCATCHLPGAGAADGRNLPAGVGGAGLQVARTGGFMVPRHSPTALNAHMLDRLFWDSRVERLGGGGLRTPAGADLTAGMIAVFPAGLEVLAAQSMFPPTSRGEMRGEVGQNELGDIADGQVTLIWDAIVARLVSFPAYVSLFSNAYPGTLTGDLNMAHVGGAIAAFEESAFFRVDSPFQAFLEGDDGALTGSAVRGALDFYSPASRCSVCHSGSTFTDETHHNIGMPQFGPGKGDGLGSDDDFGREQVTAVMGDRYKFRTPTLLNVELTAPYGHLGQFGTLRSMLVHYRNVTQSLQGYQIADHVTDSALLGTQVGNEVDVLATLSPLVNGPLNFNVDDMLAFMEALTADGARDMSGVAPATVPSGSTIDQ